MDWLLNVRVGSRGHGDDKRRRKEEGELDRFRTTIEEGFGTTPIKPRRKGGMCGRVLAGVAIRVGWSRERRVGRAHQLVGCPARRQFTSHSHGR